MCIDDTQADPFQMNVPAAQQPKQPTLQPMVAENGAQQPIHQPQQPQHQLAEVHQPQQPQHQKPTATASEALEAAPQKPDADQQDAMGAQQQPGVGAAVVKQEPVCKGIEMETKDSIGLVIASWFDCDHVLDPC